MPRTMRTPRPQLTDSWGDFDDDISEHSVGSSDDERELSSPTLSAIEEDGVPLGSPSSRVPQAGSRRTSRGGRNSRVPDIHSSRTSPTTRKSTRLESKSNSVEPELVMPSMDHSMDSSFSSRKSSQPPSARARRGNKKGQSQSSLLKAARALPGHEQQPTKRLARNEESPESEGVLSLLWTGFIMPLLEYLFGIFTSAFNHMKPLFGAVVALVFCVLLAQLALRQVFSLGPFGYIPTVLGYAISPCSIPGASYLPICATDKATTGARVEFDQLMDVQSQFEDILEHATVGSTLPIAMKASERSIRDLKLVVQYSNLPSKSSLVFEFEGFIETARQASNDLTRFNSHIGRTVDGVLAANRFTMHIIEEVAQNEAQRGAVSRFLGDNLPFFSLSGLTEEHLLERYLKQTSEVEEQINRVLAEGEALKKILENMDDRLDVIYDIVTRDGMHIKGSHDELLTQLWTKLGGNRATKAKFDEQMQLLNHVTAYRKSALQHVSGTIIKLQAINAGLDDLRSRVAAPGVVGADIPLQQHIDTIQMGLERLELQRDSGRAFEMGIHQSIMDGGEVKGKNRMVEGGKSTK